MTVISITGGKVIKTEMVSAAWIEKKPLAIFRKMFKYSVKVACGGIIYTIDAFDEKDAVSLRDGLFFGEPGL